jgi:hypothetical protein
MYHQGYDISGTVHFPAFSPTLLEALCCPGMLVKSSDQISPAERQEL